MKTDHQLGDLFYPERVAVIGATNRKESIGRALFENIFNDFEGEVVPINPNYDKVLGVKSYPDIDSVPEKIDLAIIVVPPRLVNNTLRQVGEEGIKNVVVITAGFGESGSKGVSRETELRKIADEYNLNLVGPNSLGLLSTSVKLNATFGPEKPLEGSVSFMSQSGALITAVLDWARDRGIGFHNIVSLGNKAVLDETDFLSAWENESGTSVIIAYLEGIEDGSEFISTARSTTKRKPVVMVKSGRTEAAARAVSSHTGTLAGSEQAYQAALKQAGVLRANNVETLFDFAEVLRKQPLPQNNEVGIVTNAGGPGIMATDALEGAGLSLASFSDETLMKLDSSLPNESSIYNPVDVLGDAGLDRYRKVILALIDDPQVGAIITISYPSAVLSYDELAKELVEVQKNREKPMVSCLMGGSRVKFAVDILQSGDIPNYFDPERAVKSLGALNRYRDIKEREYYPPETFSVNKTRALEILSQVETRKNNRLGVEAMDLLETYGISIPKGEIVEDPERATEVASNIEGKIVMKIVSPDILHKSDIGGVKVNVARDKIREEYEDLIVRARNYQPDATILGVQIQEMTDIDTGVETILGMNRDPQFGPVLMFGLGGIFVEVLEDVSFRIAPISESEVREMINDLKSSPLLRGARGKKPVNIDSLVETMQRFSQLVSDIPAVLELDINPLVVTPEEAKAIDLRLTVDEERLGYES
ncbi:acetyl-CoA synthetase [candidate division MSBL1 archaeon SCGC-AAA259I14]|uniref:acetate--CoA ligase (ADP-forming) n=3 Tax=candidate division MSBL1 TaxID=215777 RepID=A0A133URC9_9EURY|nr:acetyl-CoA synthetase [candidate division MSBL1 archaeon SCGC-AAA259E22]KXA96733.1 acetyl-CoA synthetase [candidate division MSBL1 archaeon SCGC-AAA259I14]